MNIYGHEVKSLLNCSDEYAEFILGQMSFAGLDFSECTDEEFKEAALFWDSIAKAKGA